MSNFQIRYNRVLPVRVTEVDETERILTCIWLNGQTNSIPQPHSLL